MLGEAWSLHQECQEARYLPIVRVKSDKGHEHIWPINAYFSPDDGETPPSDIRIVKPEVYSANRSETAKNYALSFLEKLGVRRFDTMVAIELRLDKYRFPPKTIDEHHFTDIKQFISFWEKNSSEIALFKAYSFLIGTTAEGALHWCKPDQLCIDKPYFDTGLAELQRVHKQHVLWDGYWEKLGELQVKQLASFVNALGASQGLSITKVLLNGNPRVRVLLEGTGGTRQTSTGIEEDYSIEHIEKYINLQSVPASRLIWRAIISAEQCVSKARYRRNQQYQTKEVDSQLVQHLKSRKWIPDKSGVFHLPQDMTREDLRTDFLYDDRNGLLTAIGFGENARKRSEQYQSRNRAAQGWGFASAEDAEGAARLLKSMPLEKLQSLVIQQQQPDQPTQYVPDPERRRRNILDSTVDAPSKESVQRERFIQQGVSGVTAQAKAYLRAKYKNPEGQLVCQCCHDEMPFRLRSGEHYFEAVQCIGDKKVRHYQNRLALCPTCAAMYQYARETDDVEVCSRIVEHTAADQVPSVEIPIRLADREHTLRFVGTHWFDLKTVLSAPEDQP